MFRRRRYCGVAVVVKPDPGPPTMLLLTWAAMFEPQP
jgi:hypothetical protein